MSKKGCDKPCRKTSIGGQALMEGIMMRGPEKSAMAVRRPNGEIFFEESDNAKKKRPAILRWPVIRGVFNFASSLMIGYKALMRSAEIFCEEDVKKEPAPEQQDPEAYTEEMQSDEPESALGKGAMAAVMVLATVLGVLLAVGLFVGLPTFLYNLIADVTPGAWGLAENRVLRSVFEGVLKVIVLIVYMALVSLMKDIRRTFMYHGAEHKTIFCYEHGMPLTVENVRGERRFHPRCGTSFLILMLLVSIAIGLFIPAQFGALEGWINSLVRVAIKILLIPFTMGIGYELLRFAGRHENIVTRIISAPGMWLQRITVREPTDDMIECAIMAFLAVLPEEEKEGETLAATGEQADDKPNGPTPSL